MAKARAQCFLMPEIAGEGDVADRGIGDGRGPDRRQRTVARAVIDEHDLVAAERFQDALERRGHRSDIAGLVMRRQHHRNFRDWLVHQRIQSNVTTPVFIDGKAGSGHSCARPNRHRRRRVPIGILRRLYGRENDQV